MINFIKELLSEVEVNVSALILGFIICLIFSLVVYLLDGDLSSNLLTLNITLIGAITGREIFSNRK